MFNEFKNKLKMETIFFATYQSGLKRSDRREYFTVQKTLLQFHLWIEAKRTELETENKTPYTIEVINFIEKKFD